MPQQLQLCSMWHQAEGVQVVGQKIRKRSRAGDKTYRFQQHVCENLMLRWPHVNPQTQPPPAVALRDFSTFFFYLRKNVFPRAVRWIFVSEAAISVTECRLNRDEVELTQNQSRLNQNEWSTSWELIHTETLDNKFIPYHVLINEFLISQSYHKFKFVISFILFIG